LQASAQFCGKALEHRGIKQTDFNQVTQVGPIPVAKRRKFHREQVVKRDNAKLVVWLRIGHVWRQGQIFGSAPTPATDASARFPMFRKKGCIQTSSVIVAVNE